MQKVIDEFEKRVPEVDKYFLYLKYLSTPGALLTLPQSPSVNIDAEFLDMMKSNCLLILYNLIEFAIRSGILEIYSKKSFLKYNPCSYCLAFIAEKISKLC